MNDEQPDISNVNTEAVLLLTEALRELTALVTELVRNTDVRHYRNRMERIDRIREIIGK